MRLPDEFEDMGSMSKTIQKSARETFIPKNASPIGEGEVGCNNNGNALVEGGAELEDEVGTGGGEGDEAEFVEDEKAVFERAGEKLLEAVFVLRLDEIVDEGGGVVEADLVTLAAGGQAQSRGKMRLAQTGIAHQEDGFGVVDVGSGFGEAEELLLVEVGNVGEVEIFPNLYALLLGITTLHRKTTAYNLGLKIVRAAIPHMLMSEPGSPERFIEDMAGVMTVNFHEKSEAEKELLLMGRAFAGQRLIHRDELAGLFKNLRRDHMAGLSDHFMNAYDCPIELPRNTKSGGLVVARNVGPSIVGATTPSELVRGIDERDWTSGLLSRFVIVMPEADFEDRDRRDDRDTATENYLIRGLKQLHASLPVPDIPRSETEPLKPAPSPLPMKMESEAEMLAYSDALRECTRRDHELDERLKGHYGRLHVLGLKVAMILALMDWAEDGAQPGDDLPLITRAYWSAGWQTAEKWRVSLHRAIDDLSETGDARQEQRDDKRVLAYIARYGARGCSASDVGQNLRMAQSPRDAALRRLLEAGEIIASEPPPGNRSQSWYRAGTYV